MMKNIYTPHRAERFYDVYNEEIRENRYYAADQYSESIRPNRFIEDVPETELAPVREYDEYISECREPSAGREPRKPKKSRGGLVAATVALTLAAVMAVGTAVFMATKSGFNSLFAAPQTTVSTTAADDQALNAGGSDQAEAQEASNGDNNAVETSAAAMDVAQFVYAGHSLEKTGEENVVKVDGERVYMDTARTAPDGTGTPAHFTANGKTSYGFDWNYDADNSNFVLSCNYNFDRQQYDFVIYGTQAGTAHITVYYNTNDNTQASANLTINVDENLNVTQG